MTPQQNIKKWIFPVLWSVILIVGYFQYERQTIVNNVTETICHNGVSYIIIFVSVITFILSIKITNMYKSYLVSHGKVADKINFNYDILIIVAVLMNFFPQFLNEKTIREQGKEVTIKYGFGLSDQSYLVIGLIALLVIILRIYEVANIHFRRIESETE